MHDFGHFCWQRTIHIAVKCNLSLWKIPQTMQYYILHRESELICIWDFLSLAQLISDIGIEGASVVLRDVHATGTGWIFELARYFSEFLLVFMEFTGDFDYQTRNGWVNSWKFHLNVENLRNIRVSMNDFSINYFHWKLITSAQCNDVTRCMLRVVLLDFCFRCLPSSFHCGFVLFVDVVR